MISVQWIELPLAVIGFLSLVSLIAAGLDR